MATYLTKEQVYSYLKMGRSLEQWLCHQKKEDYTVIKWLAVEQEKDGSYSVIFMESFDEGNKDFVDVYEFSLLNPDEPEGVIDSFDSVEEALTFITENYGGSEDKFVPARMIQERYRDYLNNINNQ